MFPLSGKIHPMKIFLSHSSINNASALAVEKWLVENGWGESYYLDVSETRGLVAGDRWQDALKQASHRCEAVVFLISQQWLDSKWCLAEFLLAKQLGKKIFGALIEDVSIDSLPKEMIAEWQLCDLVHGQEYQEFEVERDPHVAKTSVKLSTVGLRDLLNGLKSAGIGAETFDWPPPDQPDRPPYPGLKPLMAEDAAIFFGREAIIMRCMDEIRKMQDGGVHNTLVILGASGSGKSSFMRAGIWPRLKRDEARFIVLDPIRPRRDAFASEEGFVLSLQSKCKEVQLAKNLGEIKSCARDAKLLGALLDEIARKWIAKEDLSNQRRVSILLPIDQAEELYTNEGLETATSFLDVIDELLSQNSISAEPNLTLDLMILLTIRTDMFEYIQGDQHFGSDSRQILDLPAMVSTQYKAVIEGPAMRSTNSGKKLEIESALTEQLLAETQGGDALPLLAFTLERLYRDYGSDGDLTLSEYDQLGGINGSITAAIEEALEQPDHPPVIPGEKIAQYELLKKAFIPWLADIDDRSGEHRRRIAELSEIPVETLPVVDRLVEKHLLIKDTITSNSADGTDDNEKPVTTIEVAHEALLRHWPRLVDWLQEEKENLVAIAAVTRAADSWTKEGQAEDWLVHSGLRLQQAEKVLQREDFAKRAGESGTGYLAACRRKENETVEREKRQLETIKAQQAKTAKQQKTMKMIQWGVFATLVVAAGWQLKARMDTVALQSNLLAISSHNQPNDDLNGTGLRLALAAIELNFIQPPAVSVVNNLNRATEQTSLLARLLDHDESNLSGRDASVYHAAYSHDGERIITASADTSAIIWDSLAQPLTPPMRHNDRIVYAAFSFDDERIITASYDGRAGVWDTGGKLLFWLAHDNEFIHSTDAEEREKARVWHANFSSDGKFMVTAGSNGLAKIWSSAGGELFQIAHAATVNHAAFSPDAKLVATASWDGTTRVFTTEGEELFTLEHKDSENKFYPVNHVVFSDDSQRLVTSSDDFTARVWDMTGKELFQVRHDGQVWHSSFSPDGDLLATASFDFTAKVWDLSNSGELKSTLQHDELVALVEFSPDGDQVVTSSSDNTAVLWGLDGEKLLTMQHESGLRHAAFSPDGSRIITASADNSAKIWENKRQNKFTVQHDDIANHAVFSPYDQGVASASDDGTVRLWGPTGDQLALLQHEGPVVQIAFSTSGDRMISASGDGTAKVWDRYGTEVFSLEHEAPLSFAIFSPDDELMATASEDGVARIWDRDGSQQSELQHDAKIRSIAFSDDGENLVTASEDHTAKIWDRRGNLLFTVEHDDWVTHASFSPDGERLLTSSTDDSIKLLSVRNGGEELLTIEHRGNIYYSVFSPSGEYFATASSNDTAVVYNSSGEELAVLRHSNEVNYVAFSPDNERLITASGDDSARIWDIDGEELHVIRHDDNVVFAEFSPTGDRVVSTSEDGIVYVSSISWLERRSWESSLRNACAKWGPWTRMTTVTEDDVRVSPLLRGRLGEDLCEGYR